MSAELLAVRDAAHEVEQASKRANAALLEAVIRARSVATMEDIARYAGLNRVTLHRRIAAYQEAWQIKLIRGSSVEAIAADAGVSMETVNEILYPCRR